jgi:hypothetical protein
MQLGLFIWIRMGNNSYHPASFRLVVAALQDRVRGRDRAADAGNVGIQTRGLTLFRAFWSSLSLYAATCRA